MKKITILRGPSSSGKSSLMQLVRERFIQENIEYAFIDTNDLSFHFTVQTNKGRGTCMYKNLLGLTKNFIEADLSVCIVGTLQNEAIIKELEMMAKEQQVAFQLIRLKGDFKELEAREKLISLNEKNKGFIRYSGHTQLLKMSEEDWLKQIQIFEGQFENEIIFQMSENNAQLFYQILLDER
ncbi:MAG: hypothetical protein ACK4NC_01710 [Candidatus Gracilibacteria bacterium]